MVLRFSRRDRRPNEPARSQDDAADLDATEHAWWAQRELDQAWSPPPEAPAASPEAGTEEKRDVLAEHLGPDWRTDFGLDDPDAPVPSGDLVPDPAQSEEPDAPWEPWDFSEPIGEAAAPPADAPTGPTAETDDEGQTVSAGMDDGSDPYAVLGIEPSATWEAIVEAHRRLARRNHPDQQFGRSAAEVAAAEHRIRSINVAYQQLRIRRGR